MKVAYFAESAADETALTILAEAILGRKPNQLPTPGCVIAAGQQSEPCCELCSWNYITIPMPKVLR